MKSLALIWGTLALCGCLRSGTLESVAPPPASRPAERFFITEGIGYEIFNEKLPVDITADQAAQLFTQNAPTRLASDWQQHLPAAQPAPGAHDLRADPNYRAEMRPPRSTEPTAAVVRFSESHLVIRITRDAGNYLWHQNYDNLATLQVPRSTTLDEIFEMPVLTRLYATPYHGVLQGDTQAHMIELLGPPDATRLTQAMVFSIAVYEKGAVEISILNGQVFEIRHVPADEIRARSAALQAVGGE